MGLITAIVDWWCRRAGIEDADGLEMDYSNAWSVTCRGKIDTANVYRQLSILLPEASVVCLEVGSPTEGVHDVLADKVALNTSAIKRGTIWPRTSFLHLPATPEILDELARMAENHNHMEMGYHLYAYKDGCMLLQWHDFPDPGCLFISAQLNSQAVQDFCGSIGCVARMEPGPA